MFDKIKDAVSHNAISFDHAKEHHAKVYNEEPHKAHWGHELVAGGAAFEAMKVFEDRQRAKGQPVSHAFAKEMVAGIAAAEVDKLFETKGLDFIDREKAKKHAENQAEHLYDQHYGKKGEQYEPDMEYHETMRR